MKLTLALVLLVNLQFIQASGLFDTYDQIFMNPYIFRSPRMDYYQYQYGNIQPEFFPQPDSYTIERSGIDSNGNPFFQQQFVSSNIEPLTFDQQELPMDSEYAEYFEQSPENTDQVEAERAFIRALNMAMKDTMDTEKRILGTPDYQYETPVNSMEIPDQLALLEQFQQYPSKSQRFQMLAPESVTFDLSNLHGLGPFNLVQHEKPEQYKKDVEKELMFQRFQDNQREATEQLKSVESVLEKIAETEANAKRQEKQHTEFKKSEPLAEKQTQHFEKTVADKELHFLDELTGKSLTKPTLKDSHRIWVRLEKTPTLEQAADLVSYISKLAGIPLEWLEDIRTDDSFVSFKATHVNSDILCSILKENHKVIELNKGYKIEDCSVGLIPKWDRLLKEQNQKRLFIITVSVCVLVLTTLVILLTMFVIRRKNYLKQRLVENIKHIKKPKFDDVESLVETDKASFMNKVWPFKTKQVNVQQADLCRSSKLSDSTKVTEISGRCDSEAHSTPITEERKKSTNSSTSSWSEEPVSGISLDVSTGHAVLSYMEDHLNNKNRLDKEWEELCNYEADRDEAFVGVDKANMSKNRYSDILPYDHNRVVLQKKDETGCDYINASFITDDDPRNPAYIATQGPLEHTAGDFWQMVWQQNSIIIVSLCRTVEYGSAKCMQYWPSNGAHTYGDFEVRLVSEHVWCEDYLVRSFYLKNKRTNQTKTVTQFQFLTWAENDMTPTIKSILDFRRKVNKSYNRKSFPIIVHCNDGIGRTGTYILIDMILNKIVKEAKEIDLAATVEYMRDQRRDMVKNKSQFEYSFAVITEEVQNMLKSLKQ